MVNVNAANGCYPVLIQRGLITHAGAVLRDRLNAEKLMLVMDETVDRLYREKAMASLQKAGYIVSTFVFAPGEHSKTMTTVSALLDRLACEQVTRSDALIALGGGICGDICGFAAAVYLRGIRFVQMPTTLLAMVDSSVGGKTGVNLSAGKNLAGVFWQPAAVLCDPDALKSLPADTLRDGMAEMIKHAVLADPLLLEALGGNEKRPDWEKVIERNIQIKAEFVTADPFDRDRRQLLNFGHTFGHAIEAVSEFRISHGSAVAMGMLMAARAAERTWIAREPVAGRLEAALTKAGFQHLDRCPYDPDTLAVAALMDKKRSGEQITFIMPERIGRCVSVNVNVSEVPMIFRKGAVQP